MKILVVEDEIKTGDYLRQGLTEAGFVVDLARDGLDGLHLALTDAYDLAILDVMLPGIDGWAVLQGIRRSGKDMPVLFLTARDQVQDRVHGLVLGADDYLVKPFAFAELLARVRIHLRRGSKAKESEYLRIADLELDLMRRRVTRSGKRIDLTAKEFALLELLLRRQGEVLPRSLCSAENLKTIADNGGRFITVVPRNFREVKDFLERVRNGEDLVWQYRHEVPDSRKQGRMQTYRIHVGEVMDQGARILWVYSTAKARLEQNHRDQRIGKAEQAVEKGASGLNQRFLKTRDQIAAALKQATRGTEAYLSVTLHQVRTTARVKVGRGRPSPNTRYQETEQIPYRREWRRDETEIRRAQRTDGLFPLTDHTALDPVEVLRTDKNQPYLEKRFSTKKSVLNVAPVFLKSPRRIEAMMFLYFIALMLVSLIERRMRREMQEQHIERLPLRPAGMQTKKPTWRTIMESFHGVHLATIERSGKLIQTALKGMSELRRQILALLKVPVTIYTSLCDGWWMFALE